MCCITSKCVSFCVAALCFISSITALCLYIYFAENEKFKFLGEVSIFLLFISYIAYMVHYNIRMEPTNSREPKKSTKVTPTEDKGTYL